MAEVSTRAGAMNTEGDADWVIQHMKPTWEQIVAMQKESAALRAQAAAVLPPLPSGPTLRARRPPPRNEYPLFVPSYRDPPLYSGSLQGQNLGHEDSFRGRLLEHHHENSSREEIVPANFGISINKPESSSSAVQRHVVHSNRRSQSLSIGLSPEISQLTGVTPKSGVSGKSDGTTTNLTVITPTSHPRNMLLQEDVVRKQTVVNRVTPGAPSRWPADFRRGGQAIRDTGNNHRGNGNYHTDIATPPAEASSWKGCTGSLSMVAPFVDGASATGSGMDSPQMNRRPDVQQQQSTNKPRANQQAGFFGFFPWGKKASNAGGHKKASTGEKEKDLTKDLEKSIRNLQRQLEQSEKLRESEVRELQAVLKSMEERFEQLQAHCRNLELQMSKQASRPNVLLEYDFDEEDDSTSLESAGFVRPANMRQRGVVYRHHSVTPELFATTYDDAVGSLRKLSRAICLHIREMGESASQVITAVLENHSIAKGRLRRAQKILFFEAFLNQGMFESFENVNFEPSGGAPVLDPEALQQLSFQAFQELQSVTWQDIEQTLDEQGVIVNQCFHQFFVVRMELVLRQLGDVGETNMPGPVISAFFDAIKAVWLLHHLAFSFRPAATILRVTQGAKFEAEYMEKARESERELHAKSVFLMINPGFLIDDWVVKCRVYCSSK